MLLPLFRLLSEFSVEGKDRNKLLHFSSIWDDEPNEYKQHKQQKLLNEQHKLLNEHKPLNEKHDYLTEKHDQLEFFMSKLNNFHLCCCCSSNDQSCLKAIADDEALANILAVFYSDQIPLESKQNFIAGMLFSLASCTNNEEDGIIFAVGKARLCQPSFLFLTNCSEEFVENIVNSMTKKRHRSGSSTSSYSPALYFSRTTGSLKNCYSDKETSVLGFLKYYAERYAYPVPQFCALFDKRMGKTVPLFFLPSHCTEKDIYLQYLVALNRNDSPKGFDEFLNTWVEKFPNLKIKSTGCDFCELCCSLKCQLGAGGLSHEFMKKIREKHFEKVNGDIDDYIRQITNSRDSILNSQRPHDGLLRFLNYPALKCSSLSFANVSVHITFSFGQPLSVPHFKVPHPPLFLKKRLEVELFGICSETLDKQVNYFLPDGTFPKQGSGCRNANVMISILNHYLSNYSIGERHLLVHGRYWDSPRKQQFILFYFIWRVLTLKNDSICVSYISSSHCKLRVDAGFDCIRDKYFARDVLNLEELEQAVNLPTSDRNICHSVSKCGLQFRNWEAFLSQFFENCFEVLDDVTSVRISRSAHGKLIVELKNSTSDNCLIYKNVLNRSLNEAAFLKPTDHSLLKLDTFSLEVTPIDHSHLDSDLIQISLSVFPRKEDRAKFFKLNTLGELNDMEMKYWHGVKTQLHETFKTSGKWTDVSKKNNKKRKASS